jgi:predicted polyphosphate/ATP-dependent NAD kinase
MTDAPQINPVEGLLALSEASSSSLDEFFSKDPLQLQEREIDKIVEEYRKMRGRWAQAELAGKKSLPKKEIPKALQQPKAKAADMEF